ncbi:hypothetical protein GYMLUDRAFT_935030 [Collybiopsis luxurians FD-317 M1]|nr:hypothetical protein GYMLUDRAFT_935030 [Collybiopsis luxurians FD-317 M1]
MTCSKTIANHSSQKVEQLGLQHEATIVHLEDYPDLDSEDEPEDEEGYMRILIIMRMYVLSPICVISASFLSFAIRIHFFLTSCLGIIPTRRTDVPNGNQAIRRIKF